jgi:hypothetical protein
MSLPRFFDRVADAAVPALGNVQRAALKRHLENVAVTLKAEPSVADYPEQAEGFLLTANLAARLYPRLVLLGPSNLVVLCHRSRVQILCRDWLTCGVSGLTVTCAGRLL